MWMHCVTRGRRLGLISLLIALAAGNLELCTAQSNHLNQQLFFLYQQYWVANPISGNQFPPEEIKVSKRFAGIPTLNVTCTLWIEYIRVLEDQHGFQARFWWAMNYPDPRVRKLIAETNSSDTCSQPCSTRPSTVTNMYGEDACCTAVYMPNSYFYNIIGTSLQDMPNDYLVYAVPGTTDRVQYWSRGTSVFGATFQYGAFPFDRQRLTFRIATEYLPQLDGDHSLQLLGPSGLNPVLSGFRQDASAFRRLYIQGWRILSKSAHATVFKKQDAFQPDGNGSVSAGRVRLQPGVVFTIEIQRATTGFWFMILVLPIMLLSLFSFFSFHIPNTDIKCRMEVVTGMFLAILLLQFMVGGYLPDNQAIVPPYVVLIVSYIFLIVVSMIFMISYQLHDYHKTNTRKLAVLLAVKRRVAFQRSQLKVLIHQQTLAKALMRLPTQGACTNIASEISRTDKAVVQLNENIHAIKRAWDATGSPPACGRFSRFLPMQRLTRPIARWIKCLGMPESQQYCHLLSASVEKVMVSFMTLTYLIITISVYYSAYYSQKRA